MTPKTDTRTKLLTESPFQLMLSFKYTGYWHGSCRAIQLYGQGFCRTAHQ